MLKQTASLEKLDRGITPQKLPNLKPVHSSMSQYSQYNQIDDSKVGEGLLPQKNQAHSKQALHFSQNRQTNHQQFTESSSSLNPKMNFTHQHYHRPTNSQTTEFNKMMAKQAGPPGAMVNPSSKKSYVPQGPNQIQPLKLVAFPKLADNEAVYDHNKMPTTLSKGKVPQNNITSKTR